MGKGERNEETRKIEKYDSGGTKETAIIRRALDTETMRERETELARVN